MQSRDGNLGYAALQKPSVEELSQEQEWFGCKREAGGGRVEAGEVGERRGRSGRGRGRGCCRQLKENSMQIAVVTHNESCVTQTGQCAMVPRGGTLFLLLLLTSEALGEQQRHHLTALAN